MSAIAQLTQEIPLPAHVRNSNFERQCNGSFVVLGMSRQYEKHLRQSKPWPGSETTLLFPKPNIQKHCSSRNTTEPNRRRSRNETKTLTNHENSGARIIRTERELRHWKVSDTLWTPLRALCGKHRKESEKSGSVRLHWKNV